MALGGRSAECARGGAFDALHVRLPILPIVEMPHDLDAVDVGPVTLRPAVFALAPHLDIDQVELLELLFDAHPAEREWIETHPLRASTVDTNAFHAHRVAILR